MKTYDDPELQAIAVKLTSDDPGIRRVAVMDLVDSGEPEAVELVILALQYPDTNVRQEAAKVVDEFEATDMADALIAALSDSDEVVRNSAAHALADLKDPAAAEPLLEALETSSDSFVVSGILRALKPLRNASAQRRRCKAPPHASPTPSTAAGIRHIVTRYWARTAPAPGTIS